MLLIFTNHKMFLMQWIGYCSPGMVMNMYGLLEGNNGKVTMDQIENSFGGNICRCTGYRPILDAFKSLAVDADEKLVAACMVSSTARTWSNHMDLIANVPVRNCGTIAGNLSIKHAHKEFPSDMFIILEGCGAMLTIAVNGNSTSSVSVAEYLKTDMTKKVLLNVKLPSLDPTTYKFRSYKIMPRAQNAHAYVNAAFLFKFNGDIVESARICFGGITPEFIHATNTETNLQGKNLYTNETLQSAISDLNNELNPDWVLPDASPEYRKNLAISLFYKFVLNTAPEDKVKPENKSGGEILHRPLSSGMQMFDTYKDKFPLTQPVPKYEGLNPGFRRGSIRQ
ncbi:hypothetical protein HA402_008620 [Bradysia odoriphaga]|nr:hypothetical protein HA402_008620 [Bradysia odoriphaga]